ncbi:hypothetical protein K1719_007344 [Acacia pycnantha]|nr:hypothetical protein K1719_007344 [Acacia pycnantha]
MESSENKHDGVKIVQIETRYVQTDAMNFRDVVQSLTGKNSCTAWVGSGGFDKAARDNSVKSEEFQCHDHGVARDHDQSNYNGEDASLSSMILKNTTTSYKDFDRLLYELPPAEDLQWLVGR